MRCGTAGRGTVCGNCLAFATAGLSMRSWARVQVGRCMIRLHVKMPPGASTLTARSIMSRRGTAYHDLLLIRGGAPRREPRVVQVEVIQSVGGALWCRCRCRCCGGSWCWCCGDCKEIDLFVQLVVKKLVPVNVAVFGFFSSDAAAPLLVRSRRTDWLRERRLAKTRRQRVPDGEITDISTSKWGQ